VCLSEHSDRHVHGERSRKLTRMHSFVLPKTAYENLKRRDHGGSVGCDDFAFGRELLLGHGCHAASRHTNLMCQFR
jgi:hypothetical protein